MRHALPLVLLLAATACTTDVTAPYISDTPHSTWTLALVRLPDGSVESAVVAARDTSGATELAYRCHRLTGAQTVYLADAEAIAQPVTVGAATLVTESQGRAVLTGTAAGTLMDAVAEQDRFRATWGTRTRLWGTNGLAELLGSARAFCGRV